MLVFSPHSRGGEGLALQALHEGGCLGTAAGYGLRRRDGWSVGLYRVGWREVV